MTQLNAIQLFEGKQVRIAWDEEEEKYYFSIADIVQILTDSKDIKQYIKRMRTRDPELNSRWGTICTPTEMTAADGKNYKTKPEDFAGMSLVDAKGKEVDWLKKIDLDKLAMSWQLEAKIDPWKIHFIIDDNSYPAMPGNTRYENEPDVYFYHSDHLGGASWITDVNGKPVQHLQYLPFGEPYINQHPFGYSERFTFTGKERDEETGYGYFGARYMDHELMTGWLSVDPMSDKYPSISPYNYCMWNPVKLKDPDGREINPVFSSTGTFRGCTKEGYTGEIIIYDGKRKFDNLNADKLIQSTSGDTKKAEYYTFSEHRNTMSKKAKEKMYTHIVSQLNGYKVQGSGSLKPFDIGELEGGKIFFGKAPDNTKDGAYISTTGRNRIVATELNLPPLSGVFIGEFYEATVENIQASVVIHEWYGHLQRGWGDANKNHRYCYSAVWNDPLFQKTTEKYQEFIKSQYNYYNRIETNNKKIR